MIGPSKILTVSYGTFSCTLEGFDDPFNTMRAIAEYFRDLAADDRYFGAEPPTPDAAMLTKIAEREVQRRVEAKIQENGVVLRAGDAVQPTAYVPDQQLPRPAETVVVAPVPAPMPTYTAAPQAAPMPDGVAAKLLRIRAAVAAADQAAPRADAAQPVPAKAEVAPIRADYSEDQHADDISISSTLSAAFAPESDPAEIFETTPDEAEIGSAPERAVAEPIAPAEFDDLAVNTADDTLESDLAALRDRFGDDAAAAAPNYAPQDADDALLASLDYAPSATETYAEINGGTAAVDLSALDDTDDDIADLRAIDGAAQSGAPMADLGYDDEEDLNATTLADAIQADAEFTDEDFYSGRDLAEPAPIAEAAIDVSAAQEDVPPAEDFAEDIEAVEDTAATGPAVDPVIDEIDSIYGADPVPATGPSQKVLRARARVIKVRRPDIDEDADGVTDLDTTAYAAPESLAADPAPLETPAELTALLEAEAEEQLRRDLRALQDQSAAALLPPTPSTIEADEDEELAPPPRLDPTGEAAVSRLIEQTNEAMAVPENRRRLSAIAHLKAAVAATVAERFSKGDSEPKETETQRLDPYREDLARVVRAPTQAPAESEVEAQAEPVHIVVPRPAPLVLVSAQRIDRPRPSMIDSTPPTLSAVPNSPVRPRRVTSAALAIDPVAEMDEDDEDADAVTAFADVRGFVEFSERLGANSLAEILEAAAAYSVCIEGRPYFSRPQLMSQIGALSADSEYTREDGLRTFGALLRAGRIQKIKRGQFVLNESSTYLAEARSLAG